MKTATVNNEKYASGADITRYALQSLGNFLSLYTKGLLRLKKERLGHFIPVQERGNFRVFRETINIHPIQEPPVIIVVGFRLKNINNNSFFHFLFERVCIITTPFWSGMQGFYIKLWMVDSASKNYAGIYEWRGEKNARSYISMLIPVLQFFSVNNSIWYSLYMGETLNVFLNGSVEKNHTNV